MNKRLKLAILAQAILDVSENGNDEDIESALEFLAPYPELVSRLMKSDQKDLYKWKARIERALGRS